MRRRVQIVNERIAQRVHAPARMQLGVQHHDVISGLGEFMSCDQSPQARAHDDDPPRLLRRSNAPFAEGKPVERRDGEPRR